MALHATCPEPKLCIAMVPTLITIVMTPCILTLNYYLLLWWRWPAYNDADRKKTWVPYLQHLGAVQSASQAAMTPWLRNTVLEHHGLLWCWRPGHPHYGNLLCRSRTNWVTWWWHLSKTKIALWLRNTAIASRWEKVISERISQPPGQFSCLFVKWALVI